MENVSKTLYFTLCSRANDQDFDDPIAKEIIANNPEIKKYSPGLLTQKLIVHRARFFDRQIFLAQKNINQPLTLINLGGGLCSRFDRVKNIIGQSIHLDLPDVIDLLNKTFTKTADHLIKADLNLPEWPTEIKKILIADHIPYFTMEGVSMYLQKESLLKIFSELPEKFPQGFITLDLLHPFFKNKSYLIKDVASVNAKFYSGIFHTNEILAANAKLKLNHYRSPFSVSGLPQIFPFNLYQFATFCWGI